LDPLRVNYHYLRPAPASGGDADEAEPTVTVTLSWPLLPGEHCLWLPSHAATVLPSLRIMYAWDSIPMVARHTRSAEQAPLTLSLADPAAADVDVHRSVVVHHAATNWPHFFESQKEVVPPARVEYVLTFRVDKTNSTASPDDGSDDSTVPQPRRILYLGVLNTRSALHTTRARVPYNISAAGKPAVLGGRGGTGTATETETPAWGAHASPPSAGSPVERGGWHKPDLSVAAAAAAAAADGKRTHERDAARYGKDHVKTNEGKAKPKASPTIPLRPNSGQGVAKAAATVGEEVAATEEECDAAGRAVVGPGGRLVRTVSASLGGELMLGADTDESMATGDALVEEPFPVRPRVPFHRLPALQPFACLHWRFLRAAGCQQSLLGVASACCEVCLGEACNTFTCQIILV
jgi:hypothetical protein